MKKIKLYGKHGIGKVALVDNNVYRNLIKYKWYFHTTGCAVRVEWHNNKITNIKMHRQIMNSPMNLIIDHRDHNRLNNQIDNLRIVTHSQNSMNTKIRKDNTTGFKGVWLEKRRKHSGSKKWVSEIRKDNKKILIGYFLTKEEAAKAYNRKAKELFGEFAYLNEVV